MPSATTGSGSPSTRRRSSASPPTTSTHTPSGSRERLDGRADRLAEPRLSRPLGVDVSRVEKPWGYELIWALTDDYCGKVLFVKAGQSLSLQFHREKDESWYVQSGRARIELGEAGQAVLAEEVVGPGSAFHYPPGHGAPRHRARGHDDPRGLDAPPRRRRPARRRLRPRGHLRALTLDTIVLRLRAWTAAADRRRRRRRDRLVGPHAPLPRAAGARRRRAGRPPATAPTVSPS